MERIIKTRRREYINEIIDGEEKYTVHPTGRGTSDIEEYAITPNELRQRLKREIEDGSG